MDEVRDFPILVMDHELTEDSKGGGAIRQIIVQLKDSGHTIIEAAGAEDGYAALRANTSISCILLEWELQGAKDSEANNVELLTKIRDINHLVSIFIMTERHKLQDIDMRVLNKVDDYIWKVEDTPSFIAGRIERAVGEYLDSMRPSFFRELVNYARHYKYAWHTPGHMGGVAFLKSPVGRVFYNFYGENVFRGDLSVSVPELGSLMEHSGVTGEAERRAAKTFNAEYSYFVTNGTSTANKIIMHSCVTHGEVVIVDRNCHKSLQHALTMVGAVPIYFMPERNAYGIIGGIHPKEFDADVIQKKIDVSPLIKDKSVKPKMAVVTNSTYDGLIYDVVYIKNKLQDVVSNLHFDEAWYSYANFHELYKDRYAMCETHTAQHPAVYSSQSTHKLLAAFSQASMVHVKSGSKIINPDRFNEAFMMHTSTSPQYSIIASLDVATKMMEGESGRALVQESIDEAVAFRNKIRQLNKESDWFFDVWQSDKVSKLSAEKSYESKHWVLDPKDKWHGYQHLIKNYMMLDPIKVSILTPGIKANGSMNDWGIPAPILAKFLIDHDIVDEKTGFYVFLLLFSIGTTYSKSGTLLATLAKFKYHYDGDAGLDEMLPDLVKEFPERYGDMTAQQLAQEMHNFLKAKDITDITRTMFDVLPEQVMTPAAAYVELVEDRVETVTLKSIKNRIAAVMVVPYPPGIPVIMPGERFSENSKIIIEYLEVLQEFDNSFPGFETETHGVEVREEEGKKVYYIDVIK
ncbi:MAG: lysine decarboxylase [Gammaproteobacteria bacterium]|nr:lysine decarboxylase [Gammaproteobacteria bacterium]